MWDWAVLSVYPKFPEGDFEKWEYFYVYFLFIYVNCSVTMNMEKY